MAEIMVIDAIDLYEVLEENLGKKRARSLMDLVEIRANNKFEPNKTSLATKEDIYGLDFGLSKQIENFKADLLKWQIAMWVTLMIAVLAGKFI